MQFLLPMQIPCDGGVKVSIVAFQAVDPGSIPGHRIPSFLIKLNFKSIRNFIKKHISLPSKLPGTVFKFTFKADSGFIIEQLNYINGQNW